MFCPRCGRPVNAEANFCGGCGLSKAEIEKYIQKTQQSGGDAADEQSTVSGTFGAGENNDTQCSFEQPNQEYQEPSFAAQEAENEAKQSTEFQNEYNAQPTGNVYSKKDAPLSTVDFIWVLFISSLPFIGFIYLIYLAIQDNNTNKRSYARATLIILAFAIIIGFVFGFGIIAAGLI